MNILWVVNVPLPIASEAMGTRVQPYGGWLTGAALALSAEEKINLTIAFPYDDSKIRDFTVNNINFCTFKNIKDVENYNQESINSIFDRQSFSIVNVFGTELPHSYVFVRHAKIRNIPVVITLQGLVNFIKHHVDAGIPFYFKLPLTIRNLILGDSVYGLKKIYSKRAQLEVESLKLADFIIGRTFWDYSCVRLINKNVPYYICDESLRNNFYERSWELDNCKRHSIYFSQASNPLKGLHYILKALFIVKQRYPDVILKVGGSKIIKESIFKTLFSGTGYALYIHYLLKKYDLSKNVIFIGTQDENSVVDNLLDSHVFVSASTIENSSNSTCEAMLLGVPAISSNVGGSSDLITHGEDGFLYQYDAHYLLANLLFDLFESDEKCKIVSVNARNRAKSRHDISNNLKNLVNIYKNILN